MSLSFIEFRASLFLSPRDFGDLRDLGQVALQSMLLSGEVDILVILPVVEDPGGAWTPGPNDNELAEDEALSATGFCTTTLA